MEIDFSACENLQVLHHIFELVGKVPALRCSTSVAIGLVHPIRLKPFNYRPIAVDPEQIDPQGGSNFRPSNR